MKKKDAVDYFGAPSKLAKALSISQAAISQWPDDVPPLRAFQLEIITEGALKAQPSESPEQAA